MPEEGAAGTADVTMLRLQIKDPWMVWFILPSLVKEGDLRFGIVLLNLTMEDP